LTIFSRDWSSDVCSSALVPAAALAAPTTAGALAPAAGVLAGVVDGPGRRRRDGTRLRRTGLRRAALPGREGGRGHLARGEPARCLARHGRRDRPVRREPTRRERPRRELPRSRPPARQRRAVRVLVPAFRPRAVLPATSIWLVFRKACIR